ncbi:uncharacterized protein AMSG_02825 [Thecamonas trahens ATCC 50062]|uniref:Uncharacterized protein n=1 Tax=Thecamonas trahens ATCC 50062 TaxID=461836 RepID=A0A0L0D4Z4_THETB|nr:hypothetical protein AMSG_02825 [Thecamonas trahens ATCC 50062]KNC46373.1 hypothetical protein AMSG_02825 [Thecamonas trahens ATCC 50062]|eukprot:XP_013760666.1 hypothetical protein AMSG_02825 [Thecamonas trahens ATCC 50062]
MEVLMASVAQTIQDARAVATTGYRRHRALGIQAAAVGAASPVLPLSTVSTPATTVTSFAIEVYAACAAGITAPEVYLVADVRGEPDPVTDAAGRLLLERWTVEVTEARSSSADAEDRAAGLIHAHGPVLLRLLLLALCKSPVQALVARLMDDNAASYYGGIIVESMLLASPSVQYHTLDEQPLAQLFDRTLDTGVYSLRVVGTVTRTSLELKSSDAPEDDPALELLAGTGANSMLSAEPVQEPLTTVDVIALPRTPGSATLGGSGLRPSSHRHAGGACHATLVDTSLAPSAGSSVTTAVDAALAGHEALLTETGLDCE